MSDEYNMAKMAQLEQERKEKKTEESLWKNEDRESVQSPTDTDLTGIGEQFAEFMQAQTDSTVEISADGIDVSAIKRHRFRFFQKFSAISIDFSVW